MCVCVCVCIITQKEVNFLPMGRKNIYCSDFLHRNKHICIVVTPQERGLLLSVKILYVKVMHTHICSPFLVEIWESYLNDHTRQTSDHTSRELPYMLNMREVSVLILY